MQRLTLAFFDIPYHSRLVTTLPVVRALVERGHRVVVFTLEPFRALVEAVGAEVALQPPFDPEPPDCTVNLRTIDYAMRAVPSLVAALDGLAVHGVVFTAKCLWAALAADRLDLPTIGLHTNALWPRSVPLPPAVASAGHVFDDRTPAEVDAVLARDRAAWRRCASRFAPRRIEAVDVVPDLPNAMNLRGDVNLVYTSEALQPHRAAFDADYHFIGPCYDERAADRDPAFERRLAALPTPLIYASLGSMRAYNDRPQLMRSLLDTLADGRRGVVLAVGSEAAVAALGVVPDPVCVRAYVPQLAVLDRAALFVSHGGTNSACESLLAGVPLVMLPQAADQFIIAHHYAALGLGTWHDGPPATLGRTVDAVLADRALRRRVAEAGETLRAAGGARRAVAVIEGALAPPEPSRGSC